MDELTRDTLRPDRFRSTDVVSIRCWMTTLQCILQEMPMAVVKPIVWRQPSSSSALTNHSTDHRIQFICKDPPEQYRTTLKER